MKKNFVSKEEFCDIHGLDRGIALLCLPHPAGLIPVLDNRYVIVN